MVYLEGRAWKTRGTLAACHPYLEHTSGVFTIESCTYFYLLCIRLENLSPLFISATQATQSCEGDASKLAASFARTVSSVRRSEKTTWRLGRRRAKDWL